MAFCIWRIRQVSAEPQTSMDGQLRLNQGMTPMWSKCECRIRIFVSFAGSSPKSCICLRTSGRMCASPPLIRMDPSRPSSQYTPDSSRPRYQRFSATFPAVRCLMDGPSFCFDVPADPRNL